MFIYVYSFIDTLYIEIFCPICSFKNIPYHDVKLSFILTVSIGDRFFLFLAWYLTKLLVDDK